MTNSAFTVLTSPYKVTVRGAPASLHRQLALLYPASIIAQDTDQFVDFVVDFDKNGRFWSSEHDFRIAGQHFRYAHPSIAVPIFEWGFNWLVTSFSNRYLTFHAAVLAKGDHAVILPAPPGSGKSTMCALMMLHGWRLLSDEHCFIDRTSGAIVPFVRPISLKNNSIEVIQRYYPQLTSEHVFDDTLKGRMAYLAPSELSWLEAKRTATAVAIVFPKYSAGVEGLDIEAVPQAELFMALLENSFNFSVFGEQAFHLLSDLVGQVKACRLKYSDNQAMLAWIDQWAGQ
jgi:HprK-related kinase A